MLVTTPCTSLKVTKNLEEAGNSCCLFHIVSWLTPANHHHHHHHHHYRRRRRPRRRYHLALEKLKLPCLRMKRRQLDALFLDQNYLGSKYCPNVLETFILRVPDQYIRDCFVQGPLIK
jgi:hypothetical protein